MGVEELRNKIKKGVLDLDSDTYSLIDKKMLEFICEVIQESKEDLRVSLKLRGVDDAGAIKLAFAILESESKISLNLEENEIGDNGALALSNVIKKKDYFITLNLDNNKIGNDGFTCFIKVLPELKHGANLGLKNSILSNATLKQLKEEVQKSPLPLAIRTYGDDRPVESESAKEQSETTTSNTGNDDDKPDDSMGGGAVRSEKEDSKPVSVFLSSEPELIDLYPAEKVQNETKEQKEYRESREELLVHLLYEANRGEIEMEVEIDNITEGALPYLKDIPMTKLSGGLPLLEQNSV